MRAQEVGTPSDPSADRPQLDPKGKRAWVAPEVRTMRAGSAEAGGSLNADGMRAES